MSESVFDRHWEQGPKVVAIGGGTGLSTMLRGLKSYTKNLTAVVTVAGRRRRFRHAAAGSWHAAAGRYPPLYGGTGQC